MGKSNGFVRVLLAALVLPAANLVFILALLGAPASSRAAGAVTGSLLVGTLIAALIAWLIARGRARWPWWQLALLALPFYLVLRVLTSVSG